MNGKYKMKQKLKTLIATSIFIPCISYSQNVQMLQGANGMSTQQQNVSNIKGVSIYMPGYNNQQGGNSSGSVPQGGNSMMTVGDAMAQQPTKDKISEDIKQSNKESLISNDKLNIKDTGNVAIAEPISKPVNNTQVIGKNNGLEDWNKTTINEIEEKAKQNDQIKYQKFIQRK